LKDLQPILRNTEENNWVTLLLVGLFLVVFILRLTDAEKIKGFFLILFKPSFIEEELEERTWYLQVFYTILYFFSIAVFSLISFNIFREKNPSFLNTFLNFNVFFWFLFVYLAAKWFLEYLLSMLFSLKNNVRYFLFSKIGSFFSIAIYLFIILVIVSYTTLPSQFLTNATIFAFSIRLISLVKNNKKLIFSRLFYFILYICTLEIAPLYLLYKLTS